MRIERIRISERGRVTTTEIARGPLSSTGLGFPNLPGPQRPPDSAEVTMQHGDGTTYRITLVTETEVLRVFENCRDWLERNGKL